TTISASLASITGSTNLSVGPAILQSIAVTPASPSIAPGTILSLIATGTYSDNSTQNVTHSVTWGSTNSSVATVNSNGVVSSLATGSTSISATQGGVNGSTTLNVTSATLSSILVSPPNPTVSPGATQQFTATGTFSDSSTQDITGTVHWSSSNR